MYGHKIRTVRMLRGFSQQYMEQELVIQQNTFSRIETGANKKISIELLNKIAEILGVTVADIVSSEPLIIQNQSPNLNLHRVDNIEHIYQHQKEMCNLLIAAKDKEIDRLQNQNNVIIEILKTK